MLYKGRLLHLVLCLLFVGAAARRGTSRTFTTLYNFDFENFAAGSFPRGTLAAHANGVLYGTANEGGAYNRTIKRSAWRQI
jgi:hypothetical protein